MSRPVKASIDTSALRQNQQIVRRAAPGSRLWAVVKANAYGHGLARVWNALSAADGFAMLNLEEAILLRELGWKGPILMLEGFFHADELALFDKYRLTTNVHSNWQIKALQQAKLHAPLDIYVKVNSGMNRLGFMPDRLQIVWQQLRGLKNVSEMTLMSHFAEAENPHGIVEPMRRIEQAAEGLDCPRSLANSAATLWHPESHFNWVRPGIVLYGASPSGLWQDVANTGLKPVMTLSSEIIAVQNLKPGEAVGYGGIYRTTQEQRIGIVACGYADGYPRLAPSGTPVLVDGVRTVTVGRISMDMLAVDLTPCPQAGIGTPVELWGKEIKIDDVAATSGTVGYELMCALAPRVPVVTV
ncbi:Alanine racemase, catabolic [Klebsiella spallanzanii]|uniref:Alanine racemase n=1 Tax=Klebsiella spallanzanii TaxID=2587528 RepID=A0ABY6VHG2_9ENTR|nr:catabolic alanine racemase DadX [Klebsiella spallanzanii]MDM4207910.1 catabolic alanine racemase DadX [Klebsiella spallanzanii]VUS83743.1 Alanine racemase, catabolic [Klebsiella spallanzanii]